MLDQVPLGLRLVGLGPWDWASQGGLWELSSLWLPLLSASSKGWDGGRLVHHHQPWVWILTWERGKGPCREKG